jgi:hypothetical protein
VTQVIFYRDDLFVSGRCTSRCGKYLFFALPSYRYATEKFKTIELLPPVDHASPIKRRLETKMRIRWGGKKNLLIEKKIPKKRLADTLRGPIGRRSGAESVSTGWIADPKYNAEWKPSKCGKMLLQPPEMSSGTTGNQSASTLRSLTGFAIFSRCCRVADRHHGLGLPPGIACRSMTPPPGRRCNLARLD